MSSRLELAPPKAAAPRQEPGRGARAGVGWRQSGSAPRPARQGQPAGLEGAHPPRRDADDAEATHEGARHHGEGLDGVRERRVVRGAGDEHGIAVVRVPQAMRKKGLSEATGPSEPVAHRGGRQGEPLGEGRQGDGGPPAASSDSASSSSATITASRPHPGRDHRPCSGPEGPTRVPTMAGSRHVRQFAAPSGSRPISTGQPASTGCRRHGERPPCSP